MSEILIENDYCPILEIEELLISQNDNILILHDKVQELIDIQFNFLVLGLSIVILGVIYHVLNKFIK